MFNLVFNVNAHCYNCEMKLVEGRVVTPTVTTDGRVVILCNDCGVKLKNKDVSVNI